MEVADVGVNWRTSMLRSSKLLNFEVAAER